MTRCEMLLPPRWPRQRRRCQRCKAARAARCTSTNSPRTHKACDVHRNRRNTSSFGLWALISVIFMSFLCPTESYASALGAFKPRGLLLCRACLRREDEDLLKPSALEQDGLDELAKVLDSVSWKYWKPGQQPAQILDWMFLGDLKEATDFELLKQRGITAVLNLINWWELSSRLPEVSDFSLLYSSHEVDFLEVDSEARDTDLLQSLLACFGAAQVIIAYNVLHDVYIYIHVYNLFNVERCFTYSHSMYV